MLQAARTLQCHTRLWSPRPPVVEHWNLLYLTNREGGVELRMETITPIFPWGITQLLLNYFWIKDFTYDQGVDREGDREMAGKGGKEMTEGVIAFVLLTRNNKTYCTVHSPTLLLAPLVSPFSTKLIICFICFPAVQQNSASSSTQNGTKGSHEIGLKRSLSRTLPPTSAL